MPLPASINVNVGARLKCHRLCKVEMTPGQPQSAAAARTLRDGRPFVGMPGAARLFGGRWRRGSPRLRFGGYRVHQNRNFTGERGMIRQDLAFSCKFWHFRATVPFSRKARRMRVEHPRSDRRRACTNVEIRSPRAMIPRAMGASIYSAAALISIGPTDP